MEDTYEIFLAGPPGLEDYLAGEARELAFAGVQPVPGGVTVEGGWPDILRANLLLRGVTRVLVRIASFRAVHLAQLDKRARKLDWGAWIAPGAMVRVEVTTRRSKIYHGGAARQRIEGALSDGVRATPGGDDALRLLVRIEDDLCTISLDTSGELLHRRGNKTFVGKAPLRETLAALFLRACGYDGDEPVVDPMCGSGTLPIEAAEIAMGLAPGRNRAFAFEQFPGFDARAWAALKSDANVPLVPDAPKCFGFDRDQGAIQGATDNARRAGVDRLVRFQRQAISDLEPPVGGPGLIIVNPPYGARIGNRKLLFGLYAALGKTILRRFPGWRVGLITSDGGLAKSTGLDFADIGPPVPHGGISVRLYRTGPLT